MAFLAASLKSSTIFGISSVSNRLGFEYSMGSPLERFLGVICLSVDEIGACPFGWNSAQSNTKLKREPIKSSCRLRDNQCTFKFLSIGFNLKSIYKASFLTINNHLGLIDQYIYAPKNRKEIRI
jgi:hypothetical protein